MWDSLRMSNCKRNMGTFFPRYNPLIWDDAIYLTRWQKTSALSPNLSYTSVARTICYGVAFPGMRSRKNIKYFQALLLWSRMESTPWSGSPHGESAAPRPDIRVSMPGTNAEKLFAITYDWIGWSREHQLCKGKYHCLADLLFDWFGFDLTCKSLSNWTKAKQLNPNRSNRRSAV